MENILKTNLPFEHEIPKGTKLYFGKNASLKRQIERQASELLQKRGFEEIITPYFSYHQHLSVDPNLLLRFSDATNEEISLRADSTFDVVRLMTCRIKDENAKKLFYIQPVFNYPSYEIYQIGAEALDCDNLDDFIAIALDLFEFFGIKPTLQISNIQIPKQICKLLNLPLSVFENGQISTLLNLNIDWLNKLVAMTNLADIQEVLKIVPKELQNELLSMQNLAKNINANLVFAPLYYSKMRYYDKLFFRFLCDNAVLSSGGQYEIDNRVCAGFAVFTDAFIAKLSNKEN